MKLFLDFNLKLNRNFYGFSLYQRVLTELDMAAESDRYEIFDYCLPKSIQNNVYTSISDYYLNQEEEDSEDGLYFIKDRQKCKSF